jgi:hypothetical protein
MAEPSTPEYDQFAEDGRRQVGQQQVVARWQEQARRLLERGEGDVRAREPGRDD